MEKEKRLLDEERAVEVGHQIERKIMGGESVFISEGDREWLRLKLKDKISFSSLDQGRCSDVSKGRLVYKEQCNTGHVEINGVDEKVLDLAAQTYFLSEMMGRENFLDYMSKVVSKLVVANSINILGMQKNLNLAEVERFTKLFLDNGLSDTKKGLGYSEQRAFNEGRSGGKIPTDEQRDQINWKICTMFLIESAASTTYRLMEVINAHSENEAYDLQSDNRYVLKGLRERVVRGIEEKKEVKIEDIKRWESKKQGSKNVLRSLPVGGVGVILKNLIETYE